MNILRKLIYVLPAVLLMQTVDASETEVDTNTEISKVVVENNIELPNDITVFLDKFTRTVPDVSAMKTFYSREFLHDGWHFDRVELGINWVRKAFGYLKEGVEEIHITHFEPIDENNAVVGGYVVANQQEFLNIAIPPLHKSMQIRKENGEWHFYGNQTPKEMGMYGASDVMMTGWKVNDPEKLKLYQQLLPKTFFMPKQARVRITIAEHRENKIPFPDYRMASVSLRVRYCSSLSGCEEGWHPIEMAETSQLAMMAGVAFGYPKRMVDEIKLENNNADSWSGSVVHNGITSLGVKYTRGGITQEEIDAINIKETGGNIFVIKGGWITSFSNAVMQEPKPEVEFWPGKAELKMLNMGSKWVGLIEKPKNNAVVLRVKSGEILQKLVWSIPR